MDYATTYESFVPSAYVQMIDEEWSPDPITETVRYVSRAVTHSFARTRCLANTSAEPVTFCYPVLPALSGMERLRSFKSFTNGWDGEGGRAPNPDDVENAVKIFSLVSNYKVPSVSLSSLGEPMLIFEGDESGEIVISGPSTYSYFFSGPDEEYVEDLEFDGAVPSNLISRLMSI